MKDKKILMIAPTPFFSDRGCHIRILNSYLRLKEEGNQITILTYPLGRDILNIKPLRVVNIPGYKKTSPGFSPYKPFLDFFMLVKSINLMRKEKYDLIYAHLHEGALIGIILKKIFNKKIIFDSQGSLVGELSAHGTIKSKGMLKKVLFLIEKYITKNSDEIITSTEALKEFIIKNIIKEKSIYVIKDLPDKSLFNKNIKPAKLSLPKGKKIVVYLGGLQLYKGIEYLLKAIPHTNKKFHFLIMGYPIKDAKKLAKKLNIQNRVTFTGRIPYEKAAAYLKLGDIAISSKTLESGEANAKIYNYLAMNLPVVCFDNKENREILGNKGIYAKEKDIRDLAKKIMRRRA
jgi:glycosyltransferase involved in cell wall biosynthesis